MVDLVFVRLDLACLINIRIKYLELCDRYVRSIIFQSVLGQGEVREEPCGVDLSNFS